jgi:DGQHR domain-containing protein
MTLKVHALRVEQRSDIPLYVFGVNGRMIHGFASVDGVRRSADGVLSGYQRERVERHIAEILNYLKLEEAILPNAIVIAFDNEVRFTPDPRVVRSEWGTPGQLEIPVPRPSEPKAGLIVDGQQRVSALAQLAPTRQFPVIVVAFVAPSDALQREQFVLVNKTKPLPRDLLNELLPEVQTALPGPWQMRRVSARVLAILRYDKASPFYGRIRGIGSYGEGASISQAAVLGVIEASIRRGGVLSSYYPPQDDEQDPLAMAAVVRIFFTGAARVWPYAWEGSPWSSRLVHGVGISAMGNLMDVIMSEVSADSPRALGSVVRRLRKLERVCAWTEGRWRRLGVPWDGLQNTSQDKRRLADFLIREYQSGAQAKPRTRTKHVGSGKAASSRARPNRFTPAVVLRTGIPAEVGKQFTYTSGKAGKSEWQVVGVGPCTIEGVEAEEGAVLAVRIDG